MTTVQHETSSEMIVESITEAFYALDHEWRFTYINAQAERLLFRTREQLLGRCIWDEFPEAVGGTFYRLYHRTVERKTAGFLEDYYAPLDAWLDVRVYPSSEGVSVFFQNVNTRKLAEETHERLLVEQVLKESEERLRLATEGAGIGIWSFNTKTNGVTWTKRCYEMMGLPTDGTVMITVDLVYSMMHPDDVLHTKTSRVKSTMENLPFASEYRIITPNGVIRWIQSRGKPYCDEHGVVQRIEGVMIDITVQHEAADRLAAANAQREETQDRLHEAHQRTKIILESITDAFFVLDHEWRFTYVNGQAERLLFRTREDLLGKNIWEEFREAVGTVFEQEFRRAVDTQKRISFEEIYSPLSTWFDVTAYPSTEGLSVFFKNVNARRHTEQALRQSEERYRVFVEGARDYAMIQIDVEGIITSWNLGAERILGWSEAEVLGQPADLIFTLEDREAAILAPELIAAATAGRVTFVRWLLKKDRTRFYADGIMACLRDDKGHLRGFAKVLRDATERKSLEDERESLAYANRLLLESTTEGIYGIDLEGRFTFVNRAAAQTVGFTQEQMMGHNGHALIHHSRPDGTRYPEGEYPIYRAILRGESAHADNDAFWRADGTSFPVAYSAAPIIEHGMVSGAVVTFSDISERKVLENERERLADANRLLLAQTHARAEREALINRIGQALLATPDPIVFQAHAMVLLGEALGVDRCYLATWDDAQNSIRVLQDYRRADLASVAGEYFASEYALVMDALFAYGTALFPDVHASSLTDTVQTVLAGFALRSILAIPFFGGNGRIVAALWVAMADVARVWTPEEVSLVEIVSALIRTAVESARVAERERNIASQLQAALTPSVPERVPGMALAKYYKAALDEAGVGGDFYDVFSIDKGCTALIVGDLSGKGLAAAAQVATVRNMLRYALYRSRTIVGAIQNLNVVLTEQSLMTGFATLFVGVYDNHNATLTYVNCGQEPALVRRTDGTVEQLAPTGPVLGSFDGAVFDEKTVTLGAGDALAMFTDGLTEVGQSRLDMLGLNGMVDLLEQFVILDNTFGAEDVAQHLTRGLIGGVDAAARGGVVRDDVCLLVAVVE